ncbi:MAG TPA: quinone oxidoreductase, partial [Candidatus Tectomicrobia bacterium]
MQAVRIHTFGGPEVMQLEDVPTPSPQAGQVLVRLAAAGLNYIDVYQRSGLYPNPLPYTMGLEGSGVVAAVGANVTGFQEGDAVAYTGIPGSYAEYILVPADRLVQMPRGLDVKVGAAVMLQGMTAHYLAYTTYPLKPGDACLVHAAAGGVGLLLVQMAKQCGARVFGTVSTEEKAALAREAGAEAAILYTRQDFEAEVKRLTDGKGVQVVYDSVGKTTFEKSLNCLAPLGYLVLYGQASGPVAPFDPAVLSGKGSLFLTRPTLGHYTADRASLEQRAGDVLGWIAAGKLKLRMEHNFALRDAAK